MPTITSFVATGALQYFTVPAGVTFVDLNVVGGSGGVPSTAVANTGGLGGRLRGRLTVTPGEVLTIVVGQKGVGTGAEGTGYGSQGGRSDGPRPGGEGGGQSIVYQGGLTRANQRAVAGGGGGAGAVATSSAGGAGTGKGGAGGDNGSGSAGLGSSGTGAAATFGGPGSTFGGGAVAGGAGGSPAAGTADVGGRGGVGTGTQGSGGGGGGGYFGGSGGGASASAGGVGGGGGGGASWASGLTSVIHTLGFNSGPGYVNITVPNQAPYAPALTAPADGAVLDVASTNRFSWTYADPLADDTVQAAYEFRFAVAGSGSWTSTGPVTSSDQFIDFGPGTLGAGSFEWQVRTTDTGGLTGPFSSSRYFTAGSVPAPPMVTAPTASQVIITTTTGVTWTVAAQTSYQVRTVRDVGGSPDPTVVYTDTGEVMSAPARSATVAFSTTGRSEHVQVRIKNGGLWSPWANVLVVIAFIPPAPSLIFLTPSQVQAAIAVRTAIAPPNIMPVESSFEDSVSLGGWITGGTAPPTLSNVALATDGDQASMIGQARGLFVVWQTGSAPATAIASSGMVVPVVAGKSYVVSGWARAAGTAPLFGVTGYGSTVSTTVLPDGYFRRYRLTFTATSTGNAQVYFTPSATMAAGSFVVLDAVQVIEGVADDAPYRSPLAPGVVSVDVFRREIGSARPNLIPLDSLASYEDFGTSTWVTGGGGSAPSLSNVPSDLSGVPGGMGRALRIVWVAGSSTANAIARAQSPIPVTKGQPYLLTFWARGAGTNPYVQVYGFGVGVTPPLATVDSSDGVWRKYTIGFTPTDTGTVNIQAGSATAAAAGSFLDVDAFQLTEGADDPGLFRLPSVSNVPGVRVATGLPIGSTFMDRTVGSLPNVYSYRVETVGTTGSRQTTPWIT